MRQRLLLLAVIAAIASLIAGCGGGGGLVAIDDEQPALALPSLDRLPQPTGGPAQRKVSEAVYNVMLVAPEEASPEGSALFGGGELTLAPSLNNGLAWAIFALPGFPTDGSILPTGVTVDKGMAEIWVGLSNYVSGSWDFHRFAFGGYTPLENGAELYSGSGVMYVAVLAAAAQVGVYSVSITTGDELPGAPVAVINAPTSILQGFEAAFDATGSTGGDGSITELVWTFNGGDEQTTTDPATVVTHTFNVSGQQSVELVVKNDLARSGFTSLPVDVEELTYNQELLVVYNSDIPEDLDLVNYYSSPLTGRGIDPTYRLGLPLGAYNSDIARTDPEELSYETDIRDPIRAFLDANAAVKANVKYIVMMKGTPHRIPGANEFNTSTSTYSSVDSELCLLYQEGYPIASWIWNDPVYQNFGDGDGFYLAEDVDFQARTFQVSSPASALFTLDYLVCRISAYTYDEAKAMIDRSLAADTSGNAWTVFDTCEPRQTLDTMVDPVWPLTTTEWNSGYELLNLAGFDVFADITSTRIINGSAELPVEFVNSLIGYAGWGVNHTGGSWAHGNEYILEDLGWNYQPGCVFMSYESFNGTDFDDSDGIQRRGQGQIADFFRMGGTVAIGNAWEPFTIGVGDERWVFDRYINHGDRWIEAAYKGLRLLSWQEVVVGDPLCTVVAE